MLHGTACATRWRAIIKVRPGSTTHSRSRKNFAPSRTRSFRKRSACGSKWNMSILRKKLLRTLLQIRLLQTRILHPHLLVLCGFHPTIFWIRPSDCFTRWGRFSATMPCRPAIPWASAWTPSAAENSCKSDWRWGISRMIMSRNRDTIWTFDKTGGAGFAAPPVTYSLKNPRSMHVHNTL